MLKIINYIKDAFLIYDDYRESGFRISESLVFQAVVFLFSIVVGIGAINAAPSEAETAAIATGVYAVINYYFRLRSQGGKAKLRDKIPAKLLPADKSPDEHGQI